MFTLCVFKDMNHALVSQLLLYKKALKQKGTRPQRAENEQSLQEGIEFI